MAEATLYKEALNVVDYTPSTAKTAGEVIQLPDGRAGVVVSTLAASAKGAAYTAGIFTVAKTTSMVVLNGQKLYWDKTNSKAKYTGDFYIGVAMADGAAADTTIKVALNVEQEPVIALNKGTWSVVESTAAVTNLMGNGNKLAVTTAGSAQHAWLYSDKVIDIDEKPILEGWVGVFDNGDATVLDMDWGLADDAGTTDFDALSEFIAFHLDGNDLDLDAHSDDGTTDIAPVDTEQDLTEDTYYFFQIDLRDKTAPLLYVNGVLCTSTGIVMSAYTGALRAVLAIEKSGTDDTPGEIRVRELNVRTGVTA